MKIFTKLSKLLNIKLIDGQINIISPCFRAKIKYPQKYKIPVLKESGITEIKREIPIVASFTSFPQRINAAIITAKSILTQDFKPDYAVLYLSEKQFLNKEDDLPEELLNLRNFGLEIRWCEDIRSYKKLVPALREFKNAIIITFDDDIIYKKDTISSLYQAYKENPDCIIATRSARLYLKNDVIKNYKLHEIINKKFEKPSYLNRLTGSAGVLYPPNCFYKDVLKEDIFYNTISTHDDVWFWAMGLLNNTKVKVTKGFDDSLVKIKDSQKFGLCKINNSKKGINTEDAYKIIVDKYPQILEKLKQETN